jgi:hypothetical protein
MNATGVVQTFDRGLLLLLPFNLASAHSEQQPELQLTGSLLLSHKKPFHSCMQPSLILFIHTCMKAHKQLPVWVLQNEVLQAIVI